MTPYSATGSSDSLIMLEGGRAALRLIWAMQACGQMNSAAGSSLLSATEKVSGSISVLVDTAVHAK